MLLRFSLTVSIFLVIIIIVDLLLSQQGPVQPINEKQVVIILHAAHLHAQKKGVQKVGTPSNSITLCFCTIEQAYWASINFCF